MPQSVSAVITNYNGGEDLIRCLASLRGQDHILEVLLVDNASVDGSLGRAMELFPEVTPVPDTVNRGVAGARNRGAAWARGDILLFLDHDVVLHAGCVDALVAALDEREGVVGPALRTFTTGDVETGATMDILGHARGIKAPAAPPFFINGAVFATQRTLFQRLGGFDQRFFYTEEDVDYCWRVLLMGGTVASIPAARADHVGGGSTPGGYVRSGRIETTDFRVLLRERYTLAVLLKCAPASWLPWLVPAYVAKTVVVAAVALSMGRPRLAVAVLGGLGWNVSQLWATLRLRHAIPRTVLGESEAVRRMHRGLIMLDLVRRHGLPRFVDRTSGVTQAR